MKRLKPRYKRRILWTIVSIIGALLFAMITIPPMIHLNSLKPKIENIIYNEIGVPATIHGNINISLLNGATIVAHKISLPNGIVSSCEFKIPLHDIFNLKNASMSSDMIVNGADILVEKIVPFDKNVNIIMRNSTIKFLNKEYSVVFADLSKERIYANIKTDQHTYKITSIKNKFEIKNKNNELSISGTLFDNGTATAHLQITAQNINRWFEFEKPKISGHFPIDADVKWDGNYGFKFSNIHADGITGNIILKPDGYKTVKLKSTNADYDMSFILKDTAILKNASFDLDFYGKIKFLDKTFKHLYVNIIGSENGIKINDIIIDEMTIHGGIIDKSGAHNLSITMYENNIKTTCEFNGTPIDWQCDKFSYGKNISGTLSVNKNEFMAQITSTKKIPDINTIIKSAKRFGDKGIVKFAFPDMAGIIKINNKDISIKYDFAKNKDLKWAKLHLPFLPEFMLNDKGDFIWQNDTMVFVPKSETWTLSTKQDYFYISGTNFKQWLSHIDLKPIKDLPYAISGNYKKNTISNLTIEIAGHKFIGSASGNYITLKTDLLNTDAFLSQNYIDNFERFAFFDNAPIMIPFDLDINIALTANALIYNGQKYNNFVYSLKRNNQTFSITDSNRGNILATIKKDNINYDINIQLNKFVWDEKLLPQKMPLNISNSTITAEIKLKTSGKIARDVIDNLHGTFDASFDDGILYGLGFSDFYASAQNITLFNAERALARALESGTTPIKNLHIIGTYNMGDIKTTRPFTLTMKHIDAIGDFSVQNSKMFASLKLVLRGTSPVPAPIELSVYDDNYRDYYLHEIMNNFDADYMRAFVKSHDKF